MLAKLVPSAAVARLSDVDLDALRIQGIETLLLDLDNTITPWRSLDVPADLEAWIDRAKGAFRVCIVSNTSKLKRLAALKERLGIDGIPFVSKPWGLRRALRRLDVDPRTACAIGDQLLTDVLGGNLCGCHTILVQPVSSDEFIATKFVRVVEALCFGLLRRRGLFQKPWR